MRRGKCSARDLLRLEKDLYSRGILKIAGVDEAGRGCLAGPVFAGAVILPPGLLIAGVDDSKKLAPQVRERLFDEIRLRAVAWSVAFVDADEIDRINIHHASLKAMRLAVSALSSPPDFLLIDGRFTLSNDLHQRRRRGFHQKAVIRGDALSQSIAAASILAKVSRDRWMEEAGRSYPEFHFAKHKGYGTAEHREAIHRNGLTPLHRRSFKSF